MPRETHLIGAQVAIDHMTDKPELRAAGVAKRIVIIDGADAIVIGLTTEAAQHLSDELRPSGLVVPQPVGPHIDVRAGQ